MYLWTGPKTLGKCPALIIKYFSLWTGIVVARAVLKCVQSEQTCYRCLRIRITIANDLLNLKEVLVKFELGTGQIFSTRQFLTGSN